MKKLNKKKYMGNAIIISTSILAISTLLILNAEQPAEPVHEMQTQFLPPTEQVISAIEKQSTASDSDNVNSSEDSSMLDTNSLSMDSLKKMLFPEGDPAWAWAKVDIERLQSEMPNNLYWELAAPTSDEWLIEHRKETKAFWEDEYGQILSNKASEKQIRDYYAHQNQVSTDYVIFATQLLNRHIKDLPERDISFQKLARNLHLSRLEEIPQKLNKAIESRKKFEARRAEWLADKAAFEEALRVEREDSERFLKPS